MSIRYVPEAPCSINEAVNVACEVAALADEPVTLEFNGTQLTVYPTQDRQVLAEWTRLRGEL